MIHVAILAELVYLDGILFTDMGPYRKRNASVYY